MAEYIEKGATQAKIKELCDKYRIAYGSTPVSFGYSLSKITEDVPTADVQEVRHGKNVTPINPVDEFECSECGFICEIYENIYDDEHTLDCQRECNPDFCPHCGAKMDKEG